MHQNVRTVPHLEGFHQDLQPDYGFGRFDRLRQQLRDAIPIVEIFAEVLAALQLEGRDLDAEQLAGELNLGADVVRIIEQLAAFGDEGHWVDSFGSVCIARINAGSDGMCDMTTFILATRKGREIAYAWQDENGGEGNLGVREQPLSMAEVIEMFDAVLLAQEGYAAGAGDWRDVYLCDETMVVTVASEFYPQLRKWYAAAISEWNAAHPEEE